MPWQPARRYRPLAGDAPPGPARLAASMQAALDACGGDGPIVAASCNGGAASWRADDWQASFALAHVPVVSAACASGIHALYLARQLIAAGAPEVRVVAADIIALPGHANFEALRVLSDDPAPFQPHAGGFLLGEAAIALRLAPAARAPHAPRLVGPVLAHDLDGDDGIARALGGLGGLVAASTRRSDHGARRPDGSRGGDGLRSDGPGGAGLRGPDGLLRPALVIGQGAGPVEGDRAELAALAHHIALDVPLATALPAFGHTLGASSLLSVALAVLVRDASAPALAALAAPWPAAVDGRPLGARPSRCTAVVGRALGGACGACLVVDGDDAGSRDGGTRSDGGASSAGTRSDGGSSGAGQVRGDGGSGDGGHRNDGGSSGAGQGRGGDGGASDAARTRGGGVGWGPRSGPPPLRDPVLRAIAAAADAHRPDEAPGLVVVTLEAPLPPSAWIGKRILPSSVLEMTPGQVPQLIARAWGYRGPAVCLVGGDPGALLAACRATHERVYRIAIRGTNDRDVEWDA